MCGSTFLGTTSITSTNYPVYFPFVSTPTRLNEGTSMETADYSHTCWHYCKLMGVCLVLTSVCLLEVGVALHRRAELGERNVVQRERLVEPGEHIVFIGDSLTRYQFLSFAYLKLCRGDKTPDYLISENAFDSWVHFYENSTAELKSCTCDCFRNYDVPEEGNVNFPFTTMRENRFCDMPDNKSKLSYFQLFGDTLSLHGSVLPNETKFATIDTDIRSDKWSYATVGGFLQDYVKFLDPHPTAIILAAGAWEHDMIAMTLPDIMRAAKSVTPNVFWKETAPFQSDLRAAPGSFSRPKDIDKIALSLCESGACTYISFPESIPAVMLDTNSSIPTYWDDLHFASGEVYDLWNRHMISKMKLRKDSVLRASLCERLGETQAIVPSRRVFALENRRAGIVL